MPPDSSILPNPQARPCATLALRPGWLASGLGVGARTGLHAELTAYSIVFWGHDALPAQDMVAWQQEKARLMTEMSLAGQKGAYGKLGALSSGLNRAFDDHIELSLRAGAGTHVRTEEVQALANGLAEETSCRVLAWSVCRNHVHVIAELTEEKGVDELVCSWKALAPSMNWEDAYHTEALKAREAAARVDALISELGDDAAAAVDAEADGADSGNGFRHITVLLHETVDMLKAGPGKFIVDCTAMRTPAAPPCSGWRASVPVSKSSPATSKTWKAFFPSRGFPGWTGCWRTWAFPPTSLTPPPAAFPLGKTALWTCGWIPAPLSLPGTW